MGSFERLREPCNSNSMTPLEIRHLPLAIFLLLSLLSQASGKPNYFIVETENNDKKNDDYVGTFNLTDFGKNNVADVYDESINFNGNKKNAGDDYKVNVDVQFHGNDNTFTLSDQSINCDCGQTTEASNFKLKVFASGVKTHFTDKSESKCN